MKEYDALEFRYTDPAFNVKSSTGTDDTDVLLCFESKAWPCEANEWLTRKRPSGWPGKTLIESVSRTGCIFAPVNNKDSPNKDIQWRICSNKGELKLTETFNMTQFHCYFLLKIFNTEVLKQASGKNLTSYIMKTLMFWMSEEIPANKWRPERLISCFVRSMKKLKEWIIDRFLPNYFVVGRNMFIKTDFTDDLAKRTVDEIDQICADPIQAIHKTELLKEKFKESTDESRKLYMEIQNWMICRRLMAEHFYFIGNNIISSAHSFTDSEKSLENCKMVLGELVKQGGYYAHMSDLVRIGVLQYALAVKIYSRRSSISSNEEFRDLMPNDEVWKILYEEENVLRQMRPDDICTANELFENTKMRDLSHSPLRKATCLLLDKQYDGALELINETVINMNDKCACKVPGDVHYRTVSEKLLNIACDAVMKLKVANNILMLKKLKCIMERDIETENLEETMQTLDQEFPDIYIAFAGWWDIAIFHVTFSSAEVKLLSKALQNEAAMKAAVPYTVPALGSSFPARPFRKAFHLTLHPQVYLWYLQFLVNYGKTHSPFQNGLDEVRANYKKSILSMCILRNVLERGTYLAHGEVRPCGMSNDHYKGDSLVDDIQLPTSTDDLMVGYRYNLLVSVYVQLGHYKDAVKYLLESMRLSWEYTASGGDPTSLLKNVAYYYFKIIIRALLDINM